MFTVFSTSFDQFCRSSGLLVTTIPNIFLQKVFTPQKSKIHFFQRTSRGSPNTCSSLSSGVSPVLKTRAVFAFNSPFGTPSPPSPSLNSYATPERNTRSTHPFRIAGGCPHQLGWTITIPSALLISLQCFSTTFSKEAPLRISCAVVIGSKFSLYRS